MRAVARSRPRRPRRRRGTERERAAAANRAPGAPARGASITLRAPRGFGRLAPVLRAIVTATLAGEGRSAGEIGIVLADDAALRDLNRRWRKIDRATDVLSFGYADEGPVAGDLVISMDRVAAQARRYRVTRGRELARLVVHGALHLAGLDHQRPAERNRMRRREALALATAAAAVRILERRLRPARGEGAIARP